MYVHFLSMDMSLFHVIARNKIREKYSYLIESNLASYNEIRSKCTSKSELIFLKNMRNSLRISLTSVAG